MRYHRPSVRRDHGWILLGSLVRAYMLLQRRACVRVLMSCTQDWLRWPEESETFSIIWMEVPL